MATFLQIPVLRPTEHDLKDFKGYLERLILEFFSKYPAVEIQLPNIQIATEKDIEDLRKEIMSFKFTSLLQHASPIKEGEISQGVYRSSYSVGKPNWTLKDFPSFPNKHFWKEEIKDVLYGTDVDSFKKKSPYLANLPNIFRIVTDEKVPGITESYFYIGAPNSWFPLHVEDYYLSSISYLHQGAAKIWYVISEKDRHRVSEFLSRQDLETKRNCYVSWGHKNFLIDPERLQKEIPDLEIYRIEQNQGSFVVIAPGAYHQGYNEGFNKAEAINFAPENWLYLIPSYFPCFCNPTAVSFNTAQLLKRAIDSSQIPQDVKSQLKFLFEWNNFTDDVCTAKPQHLRKKPKITKRIPRNKTTSIRTKGNTKGKTVTQSQDGKGKNNQQELDMGVFSSNVTRTKWWLFYPNNYPFPNLQPLEDLRRLFEKNGLKSVTPRTNQIVELVFTTAISGSRINSQSKLGDFILIPITKNEGTKELKEAKKGIYRKQIISRDKLGELLEHDPKSLKYIYDQHDDVSRKYLFNKYQFRKEVSNLGKRVIDLEGKNQNPSNVFSVAFTSNYLDSEDPKKGIRTKGGFYLLNKEKRKDDTLDVSMMCGNGAEILRATYGINQSIKIGSEIEATLKSKIDEHSSSDISVIIPSEQLLVQKAKEIQFNPKTQVLCIENTHDYFVYESTLANNLDLSPPQSEEWKRLSRNNVRSLAAFQLAQMQKKPIDNPFTCIKHPIDELDNILQENLQGRYGHLALSVKRENNWEVVVVDFCGNILVNTKGGNKEGFATLDKCLSHIFYLYRSRRFIIWDDSNLFNEDAYKANRTTLLNLWDKFAKEDNDKDIFQLTEKLFPGILQFPSFNPLILKAKLTMTFFRCLDDFHKCFIK